MKDIAWALRLAARFYRLEGDFKAAAEVADDYHWEIGVADGLEKAAAALELPDDCNAADLVAALLPENFEEET